MGRPGLNVIKISSSTLSWGGGGVCGLGTRLTYSVVWYSYLWGMMFILVLKRYECHTTRRNALCKQANHTIFGMKCTPPFLQVASYKPNVYRKYCRRAEMNRDLGVARRGYFYLSRVTRDVGTPVPNTLAMWGPISLAVQGSRQRFM